ncbi:MAG: hypothetical protein K2P80_15580 [Beijerinckiaceae bacterium]|nr:hypothetical protein [Beijerinckiaceae bacterium]
MNRTFSLATIGVLTSLGLAACGGSRVVPVSSAPPVAPTPQIAVPTVLINAPPVKVRQTIVSRAKSRGTTVASIEPAGITLERVLTASPAALESSCGAHREGRKIRVLLGTVEQGGGTLVSEQRFVVDGENECRVLQTPDVVEDARRSLNELKTEVETAVATR